MYQKIELQLRSLLVKATESYLADLPASSGYTKDTLADILIIDIPKEKEFGHLATSVAFRLAGIVRKNPKDVAAGIAAKLDADSRSDSASPVKSVEVKGAGFINIFLKDDCFFALLRSVNSRPEEFGAFDIGRSRRVLLEFVSANPTGPLSVAHARQAAVGDALANILIHAGYSVTKEYYLNDEGNQINILGRSIRLRYRELSGEKVDFPEDHYQGDYIVGLARELYDDQATRSKISGLGPEETEWFFLEFGVAKILKIIQDELADFGVFFDEWYSQRALGKSGKIEEALGYLGKEGYIYESDGAVWFKSTAFGDDKDRVVRKSDGSYTYLAPDIAYHRDKFDRGYEKVINIWGPDHHGYIPRMRAAVQALGKDKDALSVIIVQLATLFKGGQPVPMSTRKGQYVTLREVLTEVGRDASRFFFLMRKTDSHLDFDLELAKKQTSENPVYYIQYAHARIAGILAGAGISGADIEGADLSLLKENEEKDLMKAIFEFGYCIELCAKQLDPYALTIYLQSLAGAFHRFYDNHKVLTSDTGLTKARLFLIRAVKIALSNGLAILGVSSPERM
ncbi:MAG TPA: arginine--tRNA ligase [Candidatus Omnitrophica bacterium]|nr:arginine--tRNA ligase [Candidatus Omnitrophota bacterium]